MRSELRRTLCLAGTVSGAAGVGACALSQPGTRATGIVEEQTKVRARVTDASGGPVAHDVVVTIFRDPAWRGPHPVAVLGHGRATTPEVNATLGRVRLSPAASWLAGFGFLVAVPTRIGYGVTGGPDIENTGTCARKHYPPAYHAGALQTLAVLDAMRRRPDASRDRAIVIGQSFGGTIAIAVAAIGPPGVQAAINFAGGGGGNPQTRPERPCTPDGLRDLFGSYGRTARMPTLWVYSQNDRYWGPSLPREWFAAFRAAGGRGEFVGLPPFGEDGHRSFMGAQSAWEPHVARFLQGAGYRRARATSGATTVRIPSNRSSAAGSAAGSAA